MDIVERLIEELRPLAEKLGQGAEALYELSVRKVMIENGIWFAVLVALAILVFVVGSKIRSGFLKERNRLVACRDNGESFRGYYGSWNDVIREEEVQALVARVVSGMIGTILLWIAATFPLPRLLNPQWYAVREVLRSVGLD